MVGGSLNGLLRGLKEKLPSKHYDGPFTSSVFKLLNMQNALKLTLKYLKILETSLQVELSRHLMRSPLAKQSISLSSSAVCLFSIQMASTGPSKSTYLILFIIHGYDIVLYYVIYMNYIIIGIFGQGNTRMP